MGRLQQAAEAYESFLRHCPSDPKAQSVKEIIDSWREQNAGSPAPAPF
jgi:regulator of sirC expression with transglutaminase-like and TPR domain